MLKPRSKLSTKKSRYNFVSIEHPITLHRFGNKKRGLILNNLFKKMLHHDVIFNVQGERFPAHKSILAQFSKVFQNLFFGK